MRTFIFLLLIVIFSNCNQSANKYKNEAPKVPKQPNILFLIADDWSYPHAGIYGDKIIETPTFDRLAKEGAVFHNAYCAAPSCAPSRASILTSRYPHQLGSAGNLWSIIPAKYSNWMELLDGAAYYTGHERKGWGPGDYERGGYAQNPAGPKFENFTTFLASKPDKKPFAYWFGSQDPHRPYKANAGIRSGKALSEVVVPDFLPDLECIRNDLLDYYFEIERFDEECGALINQLEKSGELDNTLILMTSDNGMPFPRAKANLYDFGTRMPLVVYWKGQIKSGLTINDFINFVDFGPTILEAAGLAIPGSFHGTSFLSLLKGTGPLTPKNQVFLERERHANVRKGDLSYPSRAVRNEEFLYIQNFEPTRWPAGDPTVHQSVGQFGDVDNSISKFIIMNSKGKKEPLDYFNLTFAKRPAEELYDVRNDPYQLKNLATDPAYNMIRTNLMGNLYSWMISKGDRRARQPNTIYWDTVEYTPDYQFTNFDLDQELKKYQLSKPKGLNEFEEVPCSF